MNKLRLLVKNPVFIINYSLIFFRKVICLLPYFNFIRNTRNTQVPITFEMWFAQKILGYNKEVYWPMHHSSKVSQWKKIKIGIETSPGYSPGCYIHGQNGIFIGDYTQIAPNVGIQSGNHDLYDLSRQVDGNPIKIGKYCLLGMGCVILPEVELGDYTIVGAGAIVTKSFKEGYCVIGGNPAKLIKKLDKDQCKNYESEHKYIGYLKKEEFEIFSKKHLKV